METQLAVKVDAKMSKVAVNMQENVAVKVAAAKQTAKAELVATPLAKAHLVVARSRASPPPLAPSSLPPLPPLPPLPSPRPLKAQKQKQKQKTRDSARMQKKNEPSINPLGAWVRLRRPRIALRFQ